MTRKMTKKDVLATNMTVIQLLKRISSPMFPLTRTQKESMVSMPICL